MQAHFNWYVGSEEMEEERLVAFTDQLTEALNKAGLRTTISVQDARRNEVAIGARLDSFRRVVVTCDAIINRNSPFLGLYGVPV